MKSTAQGILGAAAAVVPQPVREAMRNVLWKTSWGYSLYMNKDFLDSGVRIVEPTGNPDAPWQNAVLQTFEEMKAATAQVERLGLSGHDTEPKNWDCLSALHTILASTKKDAKILDAGGEIYSIIAPWLASYGYSDITTINLTFREKFQKGPITFEFGDITSTKYKDENFDAISCISVIEHGVDVDKYLTEMSRLLKPGGVLVTSTDYWCSPIDTTGMSYFGAPVKVFTTDEIKDFISLAESKGLHLTSEIDFSCNERVVCWEDLDLHYTFIVLTMKKSPK